MLGDLLDPLCQVPIQFVQNILHTESGRTIVLEDILQPHE